MVLKPEPTETASLVKGQIKGVIPALDRIASDTKYGGWLARAHRPVRREDRCQHGAAGLAGLGAATAFALTAVLREPGPAARVPGRGIQCRSWC